MPPDNKSYPVQVERLTKRFRQGHSEVTALDGVELSITAGEFVAVMGASGSGKSTLLHLMAGLTRPTEGQVLVEGHDLGAMSDRELTLFRRRRIGLVFQSLNLIPSLTAEENILLPIQTSKKQSGTQERLDSTLDCLGLTARRSHLPGALSGGEQQRVAIARALISDPAIVLADEPTGSLDSRNGQRICETLRRLNKEQQRTIVIVTHEPSVADWADRIVVLKDGRVCTQFATDQFDGPLAIAEHYHSVLSEETDERV